MYFNFLWRSNLQEALDDLENAQSTIRGWKSRLQLNSYMSLR
jgi:hypothetical protein